MRIVFVVGASRSGTTMLSSILGNHSRIAGLPELHYFGDLWDVDSDDSELDSKTLQRVAAELLRRMERGLWGAPAGPKEHERARALVRGLEPSNCGGARLFEAVLESVLGDGVDIASEQTPRNGFYASRLLALYPEARVVHIVRDPRAVLASQKNRWRRKWLGGSNIPWSQVLRVWANYHPGTMAQLWKRAVAAGRSLDAHPRVTMLRFEDLVTHPEPTVRELCRFLDIDYQPKMLEVPQEGSSNRSDRAQALGISKEVASSWLEVLSPAEIVITEKLTGDLMHALGYDALHPPQPLLSLAVQGLRFPMHLLGVALSNPRRAWIMLTAWSRSGKT